MPRRSATPSRGNLLAELPHAAAAELTHPLVAAPGFRLETIVSTGQASPPGFWYDQDEHEWVLLLSGAARLELADPAETIELVPGSFVELPARRRHRVAWTDPTQPTVWLALFWPAVESPGN